MRWLPMSIGAIGLTAAALLGSAHGAAASTASAYRGILLPGNPARSIAPETPLLSACSAGSNNRTCNQMALTAIGGARKALERLGGMSLSLPAYAKLTPIEQRFVTVNLERTERGLAPAVALSTSLNAIAQAGARASRDPAMNSVPRHLPGGGRTAYESANWAGGWVNPLGADYAWMYYDGPGGNNLDCKTGSSRGCWGHRDNILNRSVGPPAYWPWVPGTRPRPGATESDTVLMVGVCGHAPTDAVFTWAKAKKLLHIR
jgi:hypothetical protein